MLFQDYIISILSSVVVSGALVGILIYLSREWMSARIKGSIKHEYDQKLVAHKAQLKAENDVALLELRSTIEREATLHAVAHASFSEGQKAAMERKLSAVDRLWEQVIHFRSNLPPVLFFINVLTVDELKDINRNPTFQELSGQLSLNKILGMIIKGDPPIENVRPYVGEYLWAIFLLYQAIMLRILFLLYSGKDDVAKIEWYKDSGILQLMEDVLGKKELEEFNAMKFGKVWWLQLRLDSKIVTESAKVISGEKFGEDALQQAKLIQQRTAELQVEMKSEHEKES